MKDRFALTGTQQAEPETRTLRAGPLSADLVNGNLRTVRYGGVEIMRAVAYIVRDRDWGTYELAVDDLKIEERSDGFSVVYTARCEGPGGAELAVSARIDGFASGLVFAATATPSADFETNRCGFCILHPIVGVAGSSVTVEHVDGSMLDTALPDLIDPWQPFKDMRAITHHAGSVSIECRMEGDTFEMEDQRNWSDASYKTYVRPLALPWPYTLGAGEARTQTITLNISGPAEATPRTAGPISLGIGEPGPALPSIGVVIYPEDAGATLAGIDVLRELAPQGLLLHFDPTKGHGPAEMAALAGVASACPVPTTLEIALPCRRDLDLETCEIAGWVRESQLRLDGVVVVPSVDRQSTPPGSRWPDCPPLADVYAAARHAFPDIHLGGGMLSYFTELNRKRVPPEQLDFITHCTNPIVHAGDDLSVMQSLEALTFITRSMRAIYGGKQYRIGPSTIAMRQNPYGSATKENPELSRVPMANRDPRHNALFGAAWAVGYAARTASAGLDMLTLSALAGPFGLIAAQGEPVAAGGLRPLYRVVKALAEMAGKKTIAVETDEAKLAVIATEKSALLANLTPNEIEVDVSAFGERQVQVIDAGSIATGWREQTVGGRLVLAAYSVARVR